MTHEIMTLQKKFDIEIIKVIDDDEKPRQVTSHRNWYT